MRVIRGREADTPSENRTSTFTGTVWADVLIAGEPGVTVNNVFFAPRSRTYWHTHELGQVLYVTSGQGRIFNRGGEGGIIRAGDTVWIPPGEKHWHGAAPTSGLVHIAFHEHLNGTHVTWMEHVTDEQYAVAPTG